MVKNREELMGIANQWMQMASMDLRNHLVSFMEEVGADENELANVLCISVNDLNNILNCSGNISLATFAKLLIATDNVIEIKPISKTPLKGFDRKPIMGQMKPKRPIKSKGNNQIPNMPPMFGEMPPMFGEMPPMFEGMPSNGNARPTVGRDSKGRFVKLDRQVPPMPNMSSRQNIPSVPRKKLVSTIIENGWDEEIDMMSSTSDELMQFLMSKGLTNSHFVRMAQLEENCNVNEDVNSDEKEKIFQKISEALEHNPQLMKEFKKYL